MCVKANRNNFVPYDKEKLNYNNKNESIKSEKIDTIQVPEKQVSIETKNDLNLKKIAISSFNPNGVNFGVSIFKSEIGNINNKPNITQSNNTFKTPKEIKIKTFEKEIEYKLTKKETLKDGVEALTYENPKNDLSTLRAEISDPKKAKISILYREGNEPLKNIIDSKKPTVLINGVFTNGANAQGNIKGENLKNNKIENYNLKGNNAAANGRAFFEITKEGKLEIGKGGKLDVSFDNKYSYLMSGLVLLASDKAQDLKNENDFLNYLKKNNDDRSIQNIFRITNDEVKELKKQNKTVKDIPNETLSKKVAPRSAIGITKDNKLITMTIGKGENRYRNVANVYECYKSLKDLGAVSMAMLDGGGATFKVKNGKLVEPPEASSGYDRIPSAILIK